jgi:DNA topoisomerase IB
MSTKGPQPRQRDAVKQVSHYLGNTPAVCRASYIDRGSSTASTVG